MSVQSGNGGREDEDDHDLLTYGEAGARLAEEVAAQRAAVEAARATGDAVATDVARRRLAALELAAERNSRQTINDENFEAFFGYRGAPLRNT